MLSAKQMDAKPSAIYVAYQNRKLVIDRGLLSEVSRKVAVDKIIMGPINDK